MNVIVLPRACASMPSNAPTPRCTHAVTHSRGVWPDGGLEEADGASAT